MATPTPNLIPLRQSILVRVGLLVVGTVLLVGAGFVIFGLLPMSERVAQSQFATASSKVEASLTSTLTPPANLLLLSKQWLEGAAPSLDNPDAFNRIFEPVLAGNEVITSVVAGTSTGQGWLLLQRPDGAWRNRTTDIPRWGDRRHFFVDRDGKGGEKREFREVEYDARKRPWFIAATTGREPLSWTAPYTFFTTGDPGVTVSTLVPLKDGRELVIGFDLMLRDLSRSTMAAKVSANGIALVMTDDQRVLALPAAPAGTASDTWNKKVLKPASELGVPAVTDYLLHQELAKQRNGKVDSFHSRGQRWLASAKPYPLGRQQLWVLTLAPAADFSPPWMAIALSFGGAILVLLSIALLFVRHDARRIAEPLEQLMRASERIGTLDFSAATLTETRIAEIDRLARAQEKMRQLLADNQSTLSRQAEQLSAQVRALTEAEGKLRESSEYNQVLFADSRIALIVMDPENWSVLDCNQAAIDIYGCPSREALYSMSLDSASPVLQPDGRTSAELAREYIARALRLGSHVHEWRCLRMDGSEWDAEVHMMRFTHGGRTLLQISLQDITQRKAAAGEIRQLAFYDTLTQLPNRRLLTDRLNQAIAASLRGGHQGALLFIDLDNFKTLNDSLGHDKGDLLLQQVAQRLVGCIREVDTVSRFGGDEFLVMLEDLSQDRTEAVQQTEAVTAKILAALNRPYDLAGQEHHSTPSIGIALFAQSGDTVDELLKRADAAMYQAKAAGRNASRFFDPSIQAMVNARAALESDLRRAVRERQFVLHYQKQVDDSGHVVGAEVLLRWVHPERGPILPGEFVELAEQTALILPIGSWVIDSACRTLAAWTASPETRDLVLAVNLSGRQLRDEGLVEQVSHSLTHHGANPQRLKLEITESTLLEDVESAIGKMRALRKLGIRFALDDFGTGFSSLSYLKRLPLEELKIDQTFVRDILTDANDASIARTIIALAQSLGLSVIAEGVETPAQRDFLAAQGCRAFQGYLFGRPGPLESLLA